MLFHETIRREAKLKRKYLKYMRVYKICLKIQKKPVIEHGKLDLKSLHLSKWMHSLDHTWSSTDSCVSQDAALTHVWWGLSRTEICMLYQTEEVGHEKICGKWITYSFIIFSHTHQSILTDALSHNNGAHISFLPIITIEGQLKQIVPHRTKQYICIPSLKSSLEIRAPASVRDFHLYLVH